MTATPHISVVVCTRNRQDHIGPMLDTLVGLRLPDALTWELIIIDNGSTDGTGDIVRSYADRLPLTLVKEDQAGLSYARNTGVKTARGEYIVWTDDDVRVDSDWLAAYARAFARHPDGAYFGGVIEPVFENGPPDWLGQNVDMFATQFAQRDLGHHPRAFDGSVEDSPYGASFAVRGAEQRAHLYPTYLGVSPNFRRVGEETYVVHAIAKSGLAGYWVPDAKVLHIIPEARQSLDYILQYSRSVGETWAVLSDKGGPNFMSAPEASTRRLFNVPVWLWRNTLSAWLSYKTTSKLPESLPAIERYGFNRGAMDYFLRERRQARH